MGRTYPAPDPQHSWYEPLPDDQALARAVRWVLADPQVFLSSSSDARLLASILDVAGSALATERPADDEMRADIVALDVEPLFDPPAGSRTNPEMPPRRAYLPQGRHATDSGWWR